MAAMNLQPVPLEVHNDSLYGAYEASAPDTPSTVIAIGKGGSMCANDRLFYLFYY